MKQWPYTVFISIFCLAYGGVSLLSPIPFFVNSDSRKFQQVEWLYNFLGPNLTGIIFLFLGLYLLKVANAEYKSKESDSAGLTTTLFLGIIIAISLIIGVIIYEFFK